MRQILNDGRTFGSFTHERWVLVSNRVVQPWICDDGHNPFRDTIAFRLMISTYVSINQPLHSKDSAHASL
jgi:hypothetical protein